MICKVIDTVEKYRLFEGVKSMAVGVSGGADSMCLLHILSSLKDKYGIILRAVHINHNLRGEEALRDENLVRAYCAEKGIELTVNSVDVAALSAELGLSTEECGRKVRYECFDKVGCDAVAVAHSLSDSVETTVYNLLRGTGLKGLCGIPVKREPNIIRPLIFCSREEIESYCEQENVPFITDSSNLTDDYTRNYIRHNVIPSLKNVNSSCVGNISRTAAVLNEENDFIEKSVSDLLSDSSIVGGYDVQVLLKAHPAVRKRAVLNLLSEKMSKQPLHIHTELVNSIIENREGKVKISADLYAEVSGGVFSFGKKMPKNASWQADFKTGKAETPYGVYSICQGKDCCDRSSLFDGTKICGEMTLTSRREGDRFLFKNRGISKSLKKLFNELKIPVNEREKIAVLRDGENIIWVEGVGVNAPYIPEINCEKIFSITIKKDG